MLDQISQNLINNGYISEFSKNIWVLSNRSIELLSNIENELLKMLKKMSFKEWSFPHIIPYKVYKKIGKNDIKPYKIENGLILDPLGLACYKFLGQTNYLKIPLLIFERKTVFRKENKYYDFKNSNEFKRIDCFYFEDPKKIILIHNKLIKIYTNYLKKKGFSIKTVQSRDHLKCEIFVLTSEGFIEVANIGVLKEKRIKQFNINFYKKKVWSGYCSIGLSRLLYCFYSQKFN
jgi:hypothetical protein